MSEQNRRSVVLENNEVALTLLPGGGHIAGLTLKSPGVNPLWSPPWTTIEPSGFDPEKHSEFGSGAEGKLLAGIAGHSLCLDFFGAPSEAEAAAGLTVHGEASVVDWDVSASSGELRARAELPQAGLRVDRRFRLGPRARAVVVTETVANLQDVDRAVGWTQHVTLGPPFLEKGKTVFHVSAGASKVFEQDFAAGKDRFKPGAEFTWPMAPLADGGFADMRETADTPASGAFTAHLMNPALDQAFFTAFHPEQEIVFGYVWRRADFPWLGIWEENYCRGQAPWNGETLTRAMEFGVSPMPETRREMVARGRMFGEKCYGWLPARSETTVEYCLFIAESQAPVETVVWADGVIRRPGAADIPAA